MSPIANLQNLSSRAFGPTRKRQTFRWNVLVNLWHSNRYGEVIETLLSNRELHCIYLTVFFVPYKQQKCNWIYCLCLTTSKVSSFDLHQINPDFGKEKAKNNKIYSQIPILFFLFLSISEILHTMQSSISQSKLHFACFCFLHTLFTFYNDARVTINCVVSRVTRRFESTCIM